MALDRAQLPFVLLRAGTAVIEEVHAGVLDAGFADLRPAHGLAFACLADGRATAGDLAAFLGVTKQAAAQLVDDLEAKGYVERVPHPSDGRARLVVLTERGTAVTSAATDAARRSADRWARRLGGDRLDALVEDLGRIGDGARLRPGW
jgi:DNA-binding MarR family transcriptional regulator